MIDMLEKVKKWKDSILLTDSEKQTLNSMSDEELNSAFSQELKFGTAGLRGIMGLGTNRMNIYVVRRATMGLAMYLNKYFDNPSVVISYDSRNNSRLFAEESMGVLAANGIKTYMFSELMPVPALSFATRYLNCDAGIMITASHNPKEYNGYKVYASTGGQILDETADEIETNIAGIDIFEDVKYISFDEAINGNGEYVPNEVMDAYFEEANKASDWSSERDISIVYTPLNGSGNKPVQQILSMNGFDKVYVVKEQEEPDGNFPTCPAPNPEKYEVYTPAIKLAKEKDADIIVATDPDCDRAGMMIKVDDDYQVLTGNQIGMLLADYISSRVDNPQDKTIVTSVVSTPMVDKVVGKYGVSVRRTLVGFKWIGEQIDLLKDSFIFGFEESYGYLVGQYARDKDGIVAAKLICQMAAYYKAQGKTLFDVLNGLYEQFGHCVDITVSVNIDDISQVSSIMDKISTKESANEVFLDVVKYEDYSKEGTGLPITNMILIEKGDGTRVIVRPSGTEPKVKLYMSFYEDDEAKLEERKADILNRFNTIL